MPNCEYQLEFSKRLTAFLHATSNSLIHALSKDHNSQRYLLLQYALKSFVLTQPDNGNK